MVILYAEPQSEQSANSPVGALFLLWLISTMSLWGFAFLELPATSPEWIIRAQLACFGSSPHGLPDAGGWLVLIGSPLLILTGLAVIYSADILPTVNRFFTTRPLRQVSFILAGLVLAQVIWVTSRILNANAAQFDAGFMASVGEDELPLNYPKLMKTIPEFKLVSQSGDQISSQSFNTPVFLTFVYAHCSTVCPVLVNNVRKATETLKSKNVSAVYITLDPWRDTPSSLPSLATEWKIASPDMLLSGAPNDVNQVIDGFGVPRQRNEKNGEVTHPAIVYIVNRNQQIVYALNNAPVSWLTQAMDRVLAE